MKKLYSTLLILTIGFTSFAQRSDIREGDKYFAQAAYVDAATAYEKVNDKSKEVLQNLGDSYFYTNQMQNAVEVYDLLFLRHEAETTPEYKFRYAHALMATGNYVKADKYMNEVTGENWNHEEWASNLDTVAPHQFKYDQVMNNQSSSDFGIGFYGDRVAFASTRNQERPIYPWNKLPTLDLYSAAVDDEGELSDIVLFSDAINTDEHESSATFSTDGTVMFFDRTNEDRVKNEEGNRIAHISMYRAEKVDDEWTNVEKLPFSSENYSVEHPSLSADGSKLYFSSDMPGGSGSFDIYVVDVNEDGTYGEPRNLGPGVNTAHRDQFPFISSQDTLYFSSDGRQGFGNLDIYKSGGDFSESENLGKTINSGSDDFAFVIKEDQEKGFFASNRRGTDNLYQFVREDNELIPAPTKTDPTSGNQTIPVDGSKIYFDFDKATIKPESKPVLDSVVTYMNQYPNINVKVESHADARGTDKYNMDLSERRAAATVDYLVEHGIDRSRLTSQGYGESRPVNDCTEPTGCTNEQYAKNRRSTFVVSNRNTSAGDMDDTEMEEDMEDGN
ncbi:MAG: OmpA family protein [Bacteroidota bacterium]|uniref:Outer membrane lipoprotein omp16 n=1 Tax=Christiangramia flava JLT2011 TaxID=1229726 RepID=A0A1L7I1Q8_9FLAO|nr:OmpA family protein [Christiangramia flava]APU67540.1 Outer membrane lipoprotein omp16 precursor [Christiangramia flava JLT2011]MAM19039.1 flagellar motor protein MotB [Christiangramia sp.]MEE2771355.1 OmpA family protein [Bacteroidota bacterium]OSS40126.1 Outer membrane lipoprotein omp16 precursor [Christiangramia flava JLT2011]